MTVAACEADPAYSVQELPSGSDLQLPNQDRNCPISRLLGKAGNRLNPRTVLTGVFLS